MADLLSDLNFFYLFETASESCCPKKELWPRVVAARSGLVCQQYFWQSSKKQAANSDMRQCSTYIDIANLIDDPSLFVRACELARIMFDNRISGSHNGTYNLLSYNFPVTTKESPKSKSIGMYPPSIYMLNACFVRPQYRSSRYSRHPDKLLVLIQWSERSMTFLTICCIDLLSKICFKLIN